MEPVSRASVIFSVRTFAAAMLAMFVSYQLDLSRPTWAFITTYIVSAPLRGAGRSKGLYRICGTLCGASFTVAAIPNLVDAPELLILTLAAWVGGCLYLSIIDGTPRSYALMLAGYTTALIGFPSVNAPQAIFDTAIARTEEIGTAILCVELMSYLPFQQRAGDLLQTKIEKCLIDMRNMAVDLMTFSPQTPSVIDRAKLMIEVENLDNLRIQAHYDTPYFPRIEGWVVRLQRHARDFFAELMTFDAQLKHAQHHDPELIKFIQPVVHAFVAWVDSNEIEVPDELIQLFSSFYNHQARQRLVTSGLLATLQNMVNRRHDCLVLKQKIIKRETCDQPYSTVARYVDYRQAAFYGLSVALYIMISCAFWIATGWPEGSIMALIGAVICCFFSSLDAPPTIVLAFFVTCMIGSIIGGLYTFVVFPRIDGFPLFVYVLAFSCIPIGFGIASSNPAIAGLMLPVVIGINLADLQNRFSADISSFLNGLIAQNAGLLAAGAALGFVRAICLHGATKRLLTENGHALAHLADDKTTACEPILDRMTHRSALALTRAPRLRHDQDRVATRILLDLQASRALVQIKDILPLLSPPLQNAWQKIRAPLESHFMNRKGFQNMSGSVESEISSLKQALDHSKHTREAMRFEGLMEILGDSLREEAA